MWKTDTPNNSPYPSVKEMEGFIASRELGETKANEEKAAAEALKALKKEREALLWKWHFEKVFNSVSTRLNNIDLEVDFRSLINIQRKESGWHSLATYIGGSIFLVEKKIEFSGRTHLWAKSETIGSIRIFVNFNKSWDVTVDLISNLPEHKEVNIKWITVHNIENLREIVKKHLVLERELSI